MSRMLRTLGAAAAVTALVALFGSAARADFQVDPSPGGDSLYINGAQANVSSLLGSIGSQNSGVLVDINTVANVDAANGYATFKPAGADPLTSLLFTPQSPGLFSDFSFRGQLDSSANGTVVVTVQGYKNGAPEAATQSFTFTGLGANTNFSRIGIDAVPLTDETIQWVRIESVFKEVKQVNFSSSLTDGPVVPEPAFYQMASLLALGGLGILRLRRRS